MLYLMLTTIISSGEVGKFRRQLAVVFTTLYLLLVSLMLTGCSGGGGESVSTQTVNGVAAAGTPLAGLVKLKDSSTLPREKATVIANDGSFALDVSDMRAPFVLQATGTADGSSYTLHSFASGTGTANINPLSDAAVADAAGGSDPAMVYDHPDPATLQKIKDNLSNAVTQLQNTLNPLLKNFSADKVDPIRDSYKADHTGLDSLFDNVQITIINGIMTLTNLKTGVVIYIGSVSDLKNGHFTADAIDLPNPGAAPTAPTMITATGGTNQVTVAWKSVGNAISYNIYWSAAPGVTTASGTKISGVTTPYLHAGLSAGAVYYYIITAVNNSGESPASSEATATTTLFSPPPAPLPSTPTGIMATGGTKQVAISWSAATGATSYNIYWSKTDGVTIATGTRITGATSPTVQTGLTDNTRYYYIVTAVGSIGESAPSIQAAATTLSPTPPPTIPVAPAGVMAAGSTNQVTVSWSAVTGATSYNVYWSTNAGVTASTGTKITGTTSPYTQAGLSAGTVYYYVVTAVNSNGESIISPQVTATTSTPPPAVATTPTGVKAVSGAKQVTVSWSAVTGATSYNIYWSTNTGVTTSGTKITAVTSPYAQTGLADSTAYYYIVTAVNSAGESAASPQVTATTSAAAPSVPAAPTGVQTIGGSKQVTVSWLAVTGATSYNIYWSTNTGVTTSGTKVTGVASPYLHTSLTDSTAYYYVVTAVNSAGESATSAQSMATTSAPVPAIDGAALYKQYCAGCHGALASSAYRSASASLITTGIANISAMRTRFNATTGTLIKLTGEQIAAIAAALL